MKLSYRYMLAVVCYLALFRLDELGMAHFRKFVSSQDINRMYRVRIYLFKFIKRCMDGFYIVDLNVGLIILIIQSFYSSFWIFFWMRRIYWPGFRMAGRNTMSMCLWRPTWSLLFRGNTQNLALQVIL